MLYVKGSLQDDLKNGILMVSSLGTPIMLLHNIWEYFYNVFSCNAEPIHSVIGGITAHCKLFIIS